jgi:hypothetical protein
MMNLLREIILLGACAVLLCLDGCSSESDEIKECFYAYKDAVANGYVAEAAELGDSATTRYYANILSLVFEASESETRALDPMDRIMVLMLRQQVFDENLRSMDSRGLIAFLVGNGVIGNSIISSVISNEIGKVVISGNHATGVYVANQQATTQEWRFTKEQGRWKIDITSIKPAVNMAFRELAKQSGSTEDEFIKTLLMPSTTGQVPGEDIWLPLERGK